MKRARPDCFVFTYQGDGDLAAIGTAEIIHAANRGEDITVFFVNNTTYAMTGGQTAPTTPEDAITATSPYGTFEPSFNLVALAEAMELPVRSIGMSADLEVAVQAGSTMIRIGRDLFPGKHAREHALRLQLARLEQCPDLARELGL